MIRARSNGWLIGLAACLLLLPDSSGAGFLSTRNVLPNFHFSAGLLVYDPGFGLFTVSEDESASVVPVAELDADEVQDMMDPLRGGLYLDPRQDSSGDLKRVSVSLFGSIPTAASRSKIERIQDGLEAVDADARGDTLAFMVDQRPVTGPLVGKMQSAGIFTTVPGVDLTLWIDGYKDGAPAQRLLELEDAVKAGTLPPDAIAMPLPGTLGLALMALPLLIRRRYIH